jgi:hypothetical protein
LNIRRRISQWYLLSCTTGACATAVDQAPAGATEISWHGFWLSRSSKKVLVPAQLLRPRWPAADREAFRA